MGVMGELAILDSTGDTKIMWDSTKPTEVEVARDTFKRLRKEGYTIFRTDKKGNQSERMDEFDPEAERLIAVPRIVGG